MTQPTVETPGTEQLPIADLHVAAPPPEPPTTLGQTPHEPTVRPWELELLISGALVFSMLQIPGQLDGWFYRMQPRMDSVGFLFVFLIWYYVKLAVYALAGGFSLHLAVRGYWVGVIGLEAVFPHGIRWDKARGGPIMRQMQRERTPSLQTLIDRADRFASLIFAGAFTLALLLVWSLMAGGMFALVSFFVSRVVFGAHPGVGVLEAMVACFVLPVLVASLVDKRMGDRLDPDGAAARWIRRIGRTYARLQEVALFTPLMLTLATNLRGRRGARTATIVLIAGGLLFIMKDALGEISGLHGDGYSFLPDAPGALGVATDFYADRRSDDLMSAGTPFIQSDMVRDPYVRLFIPYQPRRHNELIGQKCGDVREAVPAAGFFSAARPEGDRAGQAVLRCMAALQPVTLDGRPISPAFRFATEPETGARGIVAYIPVDAMPKGEHLLTVSRLPLIDPTPAEAREPRPPFSIPFWL
ncbi:hypothetical protein [Longimicrobium sp.]|uniref:hypothetical protein n=1 Tax=Longimicrobium sp. TaxID=2029185 RepID=UPI002C090CDB|nr:hypothetical protein [Longimicrobium sp.]HSU14808.1 hypothetical protein [Longimicrobium sp.]